MACPARAEADQRRRMSEADSALLAASREKQNIQVIVEISSGPSSTKAGFLFQTRTYCFLSYLSLKFSKAIESASSLIGWMFKYFGII